MNLQSNLNRNNQSKQEIAKQYKEELEHLLPKNIEELASSAEIFQRKRGLKNACDLFRILLLYAVSGMSFKFLAFCADALGIASISDTAWRKRMQTAGKWLKDILEQLLRDVIPDNPSSPYKSRDVYLIDGSTIRQEGKEQKQVRIHMSYHLNSNRMHEITVTDNHVAERFSHYTMKKGDIFLADAGYGTAPNFCYAAEQGADVICRVSPNHLNIWDKEDKKIDLLSFVKEAVARSKKQVDPILELIGYVKHKNQKIAVRLIACRLPEDKILISQKKKHRQASRHGSAIKPGTLEYAKWTLLVTTLGVEYGKEEVFYLYRGRWQVELLFKRIKQNLKIKTVRAGSETYLLSLVYLWLIVWALVEKQVFLAEKCLIELEIDRELFSIWDLCSYYCKRIVNLIASGWSLLVDPFDLLLIEKYLSSRKRSNQNLEYRLCILDNYFA